MKTIYKYPLRVQENQTINMQLGAKVLCVQTQYGNPFLWALVDSQETREERTFVTFGTGHEVTGIDLKYIGTYQMRGGDLVFHVFESPI